MNNFLDGDDVDVAALDDGITNIVEQSRDQFDHGSVAPAYDSRQALFYSFLDPNVETKTTSYASARLKALEKIASRKNQLEKLALGLDLSVLFDEVCKALSGEDTNEIVDSGSFDNWINPLSGSFGTGEARVPESGAFDNYSGISPGGFGSGYGGPGVAGVAGGDYYDSPSPDGFRSGYAETIPPMPKEMMEGYSGSGGAPIIGGDVLGPGMSDGGGYVQL